MDLIDTMIAEWSTIELPPDLKNSPAIRSTLTP